MKQGSFALLLSLGCAHVAAERFTLDTRALGPHVWGDMLTLDAMAATEQTLVLEPSGVAVIQTTIAAASGRGRESTSLRGTWRASGKSVTLAFESETVPCHRADGELRCTHGGHELVFRPQ